MEAGKIPKNGIVWPARVENVANVSLTTPQLTRVGGAFE